MFGLELWFVLTVVATITGGIGSFLHKIVVERGIDVFALTFWGALASFLIMIGITTVFSDFDDMLHPMLIWACISGFTFSITLILKVEILRLIDSAVFFPLYKVAGPLFVILLGVILFGERFTVIEWIGLVVSIMVPIMLLTRSENQRQNNLVRGVVLLLITAAVAAFSAASSKQGTNITDNILLFVTMGEFFVALGALGILFYKKRTKSFSYLANNTNQEVVFFSLVTGVTAAFGAICIMYAFSLGGPLGIVYTINSLYILIPIVLSILIYNEHWNARKVIAIILSIAALGYLAVGYTYSMKWLKGGAVILGAITLAVIGVDATDTLQGTAGTMLGQLVSVKQSVCLDGMVVVPAALSYTCIDQYEASASENCPVITPENAGDTEVNLGAQECGAASQADVVPWRFVSRDEAMRACALAGKRLPTAAEWYTATLDLVELEGCNVDSGKVGDTGAADCESVSEVHDMVGNVWEWVTDDVINGQYQNRELPAEGYVSQVDSAGVATQTSIGPSDQFAADYFWSEPSGVYGMLRGGFYGSETDAGVYAVHAETGSDQRGTAIGFRCVK